MAAVIFIGILCWGLSALCRAAAQQRKEREAQQRLEAARRHNEAIRRQLAADREREKAERRAEQAERARRISEARVQREEALALAQALKEAEKERKATFAREQAEADLEAFAEIRQGYMNLYDTLEEELHAATTTSKRRVTIQRQLLTLEEKLHRLDAKRAKAYYLKGAC